LPIIVGIEEADAIIVGSEDSDALADDEAAGVADVVDVVELWLREITATARSAIPAITVTTTRDEEFFGVTALFAAGAGALFDDSTLFEAGVVEMVVTLFTPVPGTGGITMRSEVRAVERFAALFFATFFTGRLAAVFLATFFTGRLAGAFFATFLATRLAATFLAGAFFATFLAGAFLATFFALFFTATVELLASLNRSARAQPDCGSSAGGNS